VRNADQVLVLADGSIVERGTHDDLVSKKDGMYRQLVARQLTSGPERDEKMLESKKSS